MGQHDHGPATWEITISTGRLMLSPRCRPASLGHHGDVSRRRRRPLRRSRPFKPEDAWRHPLRDRENLAPSDHGYRRIGVCRPPRRRRESGASRLAATARLRVEPNPRRSSVRQRVIEFRRRGTSGPDRNVVWNGHPGQRSLGPDVRGDVQFVTAVERPGTNDRHSRTAAVRVEQTREADRTGPLTGDPLAI